LFVLKTSSRLPTLDRADAASAAAARLCVGTFSTCENKSVDAHRGIVSDFLLLTNDTETNLKQKKK